MKLQTKIEIERFLPGISYKDPVIFLGSCFANEIGSIMRNLRFNAEVNPFGVLYNPASISDALDRMDANRHFQQCDVILDGDVYKSIYHSSEYASMSMESFLANNNRILDEASLHYKKARWVVVTLGTRWIYRLKSSGVVVSNCHKLNQKMFDREALSVDEIIDLISPNILKYPDKKWIFTVSPIRHWKDGAHGNQLSKATLLLSIEKLQKLFENVIYFPAYEILMDELRDYRWYSDDMLHPSNAAVDYIWDMFKESFMDDVTKKMVEDVNKLNMMNMHKPFFPESQNFKKFEMEKIELEKKLEAKFREVL